MSERFKIYDSAEEEVVVGFTNDEPHCKTLLECDNEGKVIRIVATENGEPKNRILTTGWDWLPAELNKLDDELIWLKYGMSIALKTIEKVLATGFADYDDLIEAAARTQSILFRTLNINDIVATNEEEEEASITEPN